MIAMRSLRARIVLTNLGLLAVVLSIFSVVVYYRFKQHVEAAQQLELRQDVRRVSGHVLEHYPEFMRDGVKEKLDAYTPPDGSGHYLFIADSAGNVIYESRDTRWRALLASPTFVKPPTGEFKVADRERPLMIFHGVYQPHGGATFDLLAASSTRNSNALLQGVMVTLTILGPVMLLFALGGGLLLMNHELRPVVRLRAQADEVGRGGLGGRLTAPSTGDELESLGHTLNATIGRLEDALAYNMKFSEELSHEVRTPLAIVRMEVEEIIELPELSDAVQMHAGSALEEIAGLSALIDRLLALARLDSGGDMVPFIRIDLRPLVIDTIEQLRLLYEVQDIAIDCRADMPTWVMGDVTQIKRAIVNLLDNAVKYTDRGGSVEVVVQPQGAEAVVSIRDDGRGISEDELTKIFTRLFRAREARNSGRIGYGLGLAMVQTICAQHRGSVSVESVLGRGSTFTVRLPLADQKP